MSWEKNDISFKTLLNKRQTDASRAFYEEWGDTTLNVHLDEVWSQTIPPDVSLAETSPYSNWIDKLTMHTLIVDPNVLNNLTWVAVTNPAAPFSFLLGDDPTNSRLQDWISDKYGDGYDLKLYSNGVQIDKSDNVYPWRFDYMTGILTFNAVPPQPIQISGYRYTGLKGVPVYGTDASGTVSKTFQLYMTHDGVKLKDSSENLEIRNSTDSYYTGVTARSFNAGTADSLYLLNLKEDAVESMLTSYYVFDSSITNFNGVYSVVSDPSYSIVNDASVYTNSTGSICLYKYGTNWFLQEIDSSLLSPTQTQTWDGPFWFNEGNIIGAYFGNSTYYGKNLTIYNYENLYPEVADRFRRAIGVKGSVDILGSLGVHGKIIAEQLKLDPSFNGVLIAINGDVRVSAYPKSKSFDTIIEGPGTSFIVDHSLNTYNHLIAVYDPSTQEELYPEKIRGLNSSILNFTNVPSGVTYSVVILGY